MVVENLELLGKGSSRRDHHRGEHVEVEEGDPYPSPGEHCPRCRWTDVSILIDTETNEYLVLIEGHSAVPGEETRVREERTHSPTWVVDLLYRKGKEGSRFLPYPARKALAEAADSDDPEDGLLRPARNAIAGTWMK